MFILPIGTDNRMSKAPMVNYVIIVTNFLLFTLVALRGMNHATEGSGFRPFMLHPEAPYLYQFITYGFLHGSWMHIIGNMFFLYVFGNNVNDKLGNRGYALFYLAGCIFAGFGHSLMSGSPVLGASGAVAAVTGAYMVLFPMTRINVFYWIFFIGTFEVSALFFILFKLIVVDNLLLTGSGVAYDAHIAGYSFGIFVTLLLLHFKFLPRSHFDLWAMISRWKRRDDFRRAVDGTGYSPFGGDARRVSVKVTDKKQHPRQADIERCRSELFEYVYAGNLNKAAEKYVELLDIDNENVLPQQNQLDISNKLMQNGMYNSAAKGYELFLKRYGNYQFVEQVELMLGLIYARYLAMPERAKEMLERAHGKLSNEGQRKLCEETMKSINY